MTRNLLLFMLVLLLGLAATSALAQEDGEDPGVTGDGNGTGVCEFIDEDGDGFNDLAPDADGDGIPNGLDPDYVRPQDGTGMQSQWGRWEDFLAHFGVQNFAGDGVMSMFRNGPGDGTGDPGSNEDGTGFGPGTSTGEGSGSSQGGTGNGDDPHGGDSQGGGRGGSGGNSGGGGNS